MNKILSLFLTPLFYVTFGLILLIFHPIQVFTRNVFGAKAHDMTVGWLNLWITAALGILGTRVTYRNFVPLPLNEPILVISNHQSMWDISPVIWKLRKKRTKYIAKSSLARFIPSISYNLRYGGSLSIDRSDKEGSFDKISAFAKFIAEKKFAIVIYPEGTRSKDGTIKPFKSGGIAEILKVIPDITVVPIAIKNTGKIDNGGKFLKRIGVHASFTMLPLRKVNRADLETELEAIREEIKGTLTE